MAIPNPATVITVDALGPAMDLDRHEHIAIVGGGGKTTLSHALARHLGATPADRRCVLTTTTKMGRDQDGGLPVLIDPTDATIAAVEHPTVAWGATDGPKALGVEAATCDRWFELLDHLVVEADGARRLPFKAPAPYEPVVGSSATIVVSVIGVDALGAVISDRCHRPEVVAERAGCRPGDVLTPERAARVLLHPQGFRRAVPAGARLVMVATKVTPEREPVARELACALAAIEVVPFFAVTLG
jgi:molybdenum cofactor cytidylyltransferase